MRRTTIALVAGVVALGPAACGSDATGSGSGGAVSTASGSASPSVSGDLTVLAAASLTESFTTLGQQFEAAHPGVEVTLGFGASSALATQITSGAPADVFASASASTMEAVVAAGAAAAPKTFAENVMEIAVPPDNPGKVTGVSSLAGADVKTALCQPQVPCGTAAQQVFTNAKVTVTPVTLEPDVKSVLSKVQLGEVDAGVVYVTDVLAAGDKVNGVEIPADVNASTSYRIAALARSGNAATAAAFVEYVLSPAGTRVLTAAGFQQP
jgi:molybdate transport system substrate-binding protein